MHGNIWSTIYGLSVPAGLTLFVGLLQWAFRRKLPKKTLILSGVLALIPIFFVVGHIYSQKSEMRKRQGTYSVIHSERIDEICNPSNVDSLQLTLSKAGRYSFNIRPCFADRKEGKWKWQDDMVGAYAVFEIEIYNYAYLHFDDDDTLRLIREGRDYLTFVRLGTKD